MDTIEMDRRDFLRDALALPDAQDSGDAVTTADGELDGAQMGEEETDIERYDTETYRGHADGPLRAGFA
jgi:hypothetical protein